MTKKIEDMTLEEITDEISKKQPEYGGGFVLALEGLLIISLIEKMFSFSSNKLFGEDEILTRLLILNDAKSELLYLSKSEKDAFSKANRTKGITDIDISILNSLCIADNAFGLLGILKENRKRINKSFQSDINICIGTLENILKNSMSLFEENLKYFKQESRRSEYFERCFGSNKEIEKEVLELVKKL